ncbi:MAG: HIT family protein [Bacteroidota bacterium]|nr:HIT family protein [Bacteroidota bacterium]
MNSLFSKIIRGEIPSYKLAENQFCYAFFDSKPLTKGHSLVVPKQEIDYIFDVPDELLMEMILFSKKLATAIKKNVSCTKVGLCIIGLEVPHAHIHLVPINQIADLNFSNNRVNISDLEMQSLAAKIAQDFIALT